MAELSCAQDTMVYQRHYLRKMSESGTRHLGLHFIGEYFVCQLHHRERACCTMILPGHHVKGLDNEYVFLNRVVSFPISRKT